MKVAYNWRSVARSGNSAREGAPSSDTPGTLRLGVTRLAPTEGERDMGNRRHEQAAVLALAAHASGGWHLVAQLIEEAGSAQRLAEGELTGFETPELAPASGSSTRARTPT
jgi:hypothetical protein